MPEYPRSPFNKEYKYPTSMTNDTTWTNVIPPGYMLESVVLVESAGNVPTLNLGTSAGASDVFSQQAMIASDITVLVVNKVFSMLSSQTLYLNDDGIGTWNSASLTAILLMKRAMI